MTTTRTVPGRGRPVDAPLRGLEEFGSQVWFYGRSYGEVPLALRKYKREVMRLLAEVSFGSGALAVVGGTVVIVTFLTAFAGIEIGLQGYTELSNIGVEALAGFISAYFNVRVAAPLIGSIALIATVGAGYTAQLGAMRVSEEIDALEVMAVPAATYLVSTRIIAGTIAIIPLFAVALLGSVTATRFIVTVFYGQSPGSYDHYFETFLIPTDIFLSLLIVVFNAVVIMSVHTYYGFTASGGPVGVGRAVGNAVRLSLLAVLITQMLSTLALYGPSDTLNISG